MSKEIKNTREEFTQEVATTVGADMIIDIEEIEQENAHFIKVGAIGVGNTGGQNAALAMIKYGIPAVVINSSARDLDSIPNSVPKILIGSGKGSGKDREVGREYFLQVGGEVIEEDDIVALIDECDVISIQFSLGGGQGSSAGPVLYNLLTQVYEGTGKVFIMQIVCQSNDDMLVAQEHAIDCLTEIKTDTPDATYLIYDNAKFPELNTRDLYARVNANMAKDLSILRGDYITLTDLDGVDEEELLNVCRTPGRMAIGYLEDFSDYQLEGSLTNTLKSEINNRSAHVILEDDKVVSSSALIYNVVESDSDLVMNVKQDVQGVFGYHISDYRNENVTMVEDSLNSAYIILAGLSEPDTRIKAMLDRKKEIERSVIQSRNTKSSLLTSTPRDKKDSLLTKLNQQKKSPTSLLAGSSNGVAKPKPSAADILGMYKNKK